jgi:hypothetical protein
MVGLRTRVTLFNVILDIILLLLFLSLPNITSLVILYDSTRLGI